MSILVHLRDEKRGTEVEKAITDHILDSQVKALFDCWIFILSMKYDTNTIQRISAKQSNKYRDKRSLGRLSEQNKKTGYRNKTKMYTKTAKLKKKTAYKNKVKIYNNLPHHKGRISIILIINSQDFNKYTLIDCQF